MDARIHDIGKLFQGQLRLVVPIYQRPYVWTEDKQWGPLWSDIQRLAGQVAAGNSAKPHFMGAVVVDVDPKPIGYLSCYIVVDGQQRLTTIQVFLEAMADCFEHMCDSGCEEVRLFAERSRSITRNQFVTPEDKDGEFKVWPMNVDQAAFRAVMNSGSPQHFEDVHAGDPTILESRVAQAYAFFFGRILDWLNSQPDVGLAAKSLYDVVDRYFQIVVIDLQNSVDPQLIFETLNARGTPLLPSDLIKNYLFHQAVLEQTDGADLYAEYWQPFEDEYSYWSETLGKGSGRRARLDIFMHQYLTMKVRDDVQTGKLYLEYRDFADKSGMTVTEQLAGLERFGGVFRGLDHLDPSSREAQFIQRLRVMENNTVMPFVLALMGDEWILPEERVQIIEYLESFLMRRMICHLTGKAYNRIFVDLIKATDGRIKADAVRDVLLGWTEETNIWPDDATFHAAWIGNQAYNWLAQSRVRMVLEAIEPFVRSNKAEKVVQEVLTIEHLMPQQWRTHYPLPADGSIDEYERERVINTFGNLTLITQRLNPSLSNGPWSTDQDLEKDKGKRAEILRHAGLGMTRMLVDYKTWDEKSIRKRGETLFKAAVKAWPYPGA